MKLILIRHGESFLNQSNSFSGWNNSPLTVNGEKQAENYGVKLKEKGISFPIIHTSVLLRAQQTVEKILLTYPQNIISLNYSWRLNGRYMGALDGISRNDLQYSPETINKIRTDYNCAPPKKLFIPNDINYAELKSNNIKIYGESFKNLFDRLIPYWKDNIVINIHNYNQLICAHAHSIKVLVQIIEGLSNEMVEKLNIKQNEIIIYSFKNGKLVNKEILFV